MNWKKISIEDKHLVIDETGCDILTATKALHMAKGDLAVAILYARYPKEYYVDHHHLDW